MPNDKNAIEEMIVKLTADTSDFVKQIKDAVDEGTKVAKKSSEETAAAIGSQQEELAGGLSSIKDFIGGLSGGLSGILGMIESLAPYLGLITGIFTVAKKGIDNMVKSAAEGLAQLQTEQRFRAMSASVSSSGDEMLAAMQNVTGGFISDTDLMAQAMAALDSQIVITPDALEELTRGAVGLSNALNIPEQQAFMELLTAIQNADTNSLAQMGIDVNEFTDAIAQQDYGVPFEMLDSFTQHLVFVDAALAGASAKADEFGTSLDGLGSSASQYDAYMSNIAEGSDRAKLVLVDFVKNGWNILKDSLLDLDFFANNADKADGWAGQMVNAIADVSGALLALTDVASMTGDALNKLFSGDFAGFTDKLSSINFKDLYETEKAPIQDYLNDRYKNVLSPKPIENAVFGTGIQSFQNQDQASLRSAGQGLAKQIQDATLQGTAQSEAAATAHQNRLAAIDERGAKQRLAIGDKFSAAMEKLTEDTAKRRAKIESDYNARVKKNKDDFDKEEARAEEDHQTEMQRLRDRYIYDLEDAVKARDARAIVDLRRKYELDKKLANEDNQTRSERRKQDHSDELDQLRTQEEDALAELEAATADRAQALRDARDNDLANLEQSLIDQAQAENDSYDQRLAAIAAANQSRLVKIAEGFANDKSVTEDGARQIFDAMGKVFGVDGDIDAMMDAFIKRRSKDLEVAQALQGAFTMSGVSKSQTVSNYLTGLGGMSGGLDLTRGPHLADGGMYLAKKPTLLAVGEKEAEVVSAAPISKLSSLSGGGSGNPVSGSLNINFSGSAPPGIGVRERDAIARTLLDAIRETGVLAP